MKEMACSKKHYLREIGIACVGSVSLRRWSMGETLEQSEGDAGDARDTYGKMTLQKVPI